MSFGVHMCPYGFFSIFLDFSGTLGVLYSILCVLMVFNGSLRVFIGFYAFL